MIKHHKIGSRKEEDERLLGGSEDIEKKIKKRSHNDQFYKVIVCLNTVS
jgi:hypothetical protein